MSSECNDLFDFTRALVDVDSTTGQEAAAARLVAEHLRRRTALTVEVWPVEPGRDNIFAHCGAPRVVMSTHLDTVPPFFPSREDDEFIHGRGACDAKGICAAQVFAAEQLLARGVSDFGLLFVVGEERNSAGALAANPLAPPLPAGAERFLINGEPTESRMIAAGKGVLRVDVRAQGTLAHSAYPELGDSAIEKLLSALARIRALDLPRDPVLGETTVNIGTLSGGRAPNVVADAARAELLIRLVADPAPLKSAITAAVAGVAEAEFVLELPPRRFLTLPGYETGTVAFGTDIPKLGNWGEPLLFGPGSIHLAHTIEERIAKRELAAAVAAYAEMTERLLGSSTIPRQHAANN